MSEGSYLEKLGLFAVENVLDREFCIRLHNVIEDSEQLQTPLQQFVQSDEATVGGNPRPKVVLDLPEEFSAEIRRKLTEIMPLARSFFDLDIEAVRDPYAIIYEKGKFTAKHADTADTEGVERNSETKKITTILYLNDEGDDAIENGYVGGKLTFHGLIKNDVFEKFGYPVKGEAGKLIAFPSTYLHEVTEVTSGVRYVISSGYY